MSGIVAHYIQYFPLQADNTKPLPHNFYQCCQPVMPTPLVGHWFVYLIDLIGSPIAKLNRAQDRNAAAFLLGSGLALLSCNRKCLLNVESPGKNLYNRFSKS